MFRFNVIKVGNADFIAGSKVEVKFGSQGGVVFSDKPIRPNTQFSVKLIKDEKWTKPQEFIFGLTSIKPTIWQAAQELVDKFSFSSHSWHFDLSRKIDYTEDDKMPAKEIFEELETISLFYDNENSIRFWINGKEIPRCYPLYCVPPPRRLWAFVYTKMQRVSLLPMVEILPFLDTREPDGTIEVHVVIDNPDILQAMEGAHEDMDKTAETLLKHHPLLSETSWILPTGTKDKFDQEVEDCNYKNAVMNLMCIRYPGCEIAKDRRGNKVVTLTSIRNKLSELGCEHDSKEGSYVGDCLKLNMQDPDNCYSGVDYITCFYIVFNQMECESPYEHRVQGGDADNCAFEMIHRAVLELCCQGKLKGRHVFDPLPAPDERPPDVTFSDWMKRCTGYPDLGAGGDASPYQPEEGTEIHEEAAAEEEPTVAPCDYFSLCKRFMDSLDIPGEYLDHTHDRCYCETCMTARKDKLHYSRGNPPKLYAMPVGWVKFGLVLGPQAKIFDIFNKWHVAFHGTKAESVASILASRDLLMPGDIAVGGKVMSPVHGHFTEERKPEGFDVKQVFVSPSIRYAGLETYAKIKSWTDPETNITYLARVVLVLRIKPGSYTVGPETVLPAGLKRTLSIDPKISNLELEWSTKERGATIPVGVIVKLDALN